METSLAAATAAATQAKRPPPEAHQWHKQLMLMDKQKSKRKYIYYFIFMYILYEGVVVDSIITISKQHLLALKQVHIMVTSVCSTYRYVIMYVV
jgi:hypothetical protein